MTNELNIQSTINGIHLKESILWFDSFESPGVSFISCGMNKNPPKTTNIIASEDTVSIYSIRFKQKVESSLKCGFNHMIGLGLYRFELLPSGSTLGGASLYVEDDLNSLLYASDIFTHKLKTIRGFQIKKADKLVVKAQHPDPNNEFPNRKKELQKLLELIHNYNDNNLTPIIIVDEAPIAQELCHVFYEESITVSVHPTIYAINKYYEKKNITLGNYSKLSLGHDSDVFLVPMNKIKKFISLNSEFYNSKPKIFIKKRMIEANSNEHIYDNIIYLTHMADGLGLKEIISNVEPNELYITGPYAKEYADEFRSLATIVQPLYPNNQPTLF